MTDDRQQFGTALGLSAGLNALLFLGVAWFMAVQAGLMPKSKPLSPPEPEAEEIIVQLSTAPEPERERVVEPPPMAPDKKAFANANPNQAEQAPDKKDTRFTSSQDMRAASEKDASPEGTEGMATRDGLLDRPSLEMTDSDFRDGEEQAPAPPAAPRTALPLPLAQAPTPGTADSQASPPATSEYPAKTQPDDRPADQNPEIARADTAANFPPPELQQDPPDRNRPPDPAESAGPAEEAPPLAFRDSTSQTVTPVADPLPKPALRPKPATPPPLTRIPDRVPDYNPGLKATRSLGKITNKGEASVDAEASMEGKYAKAIRGAIEKNWRPKLASLAGFANPGVVEIEFEIDAKGRISGVKLLNPGEANPVMQDVGLSAIITAKLPPPPAELLDSAGGTRMRRTFSFLTY